MGAMELLVSYVVVSWAMSRSKIFRITACGIWKYLYSRVEHETATITDIALCLFQSDWNQGWQGHVLQPIKHGLDMLNTVVGRIGSQPRFVFAKVQVRNLEKTWFCPFDFNKYKIRTRILKSKRVQEGNALHFGRL